MKPYSMLSLVRHCLLLLALSILSLPAYSQLGCTDELACNYDPGAATDDGSCTYTGFFIPLDYDASASEPAIQACSAPEGYYFADQTCIENVITGDPYCINTDWDSLCEEDYNDCLGCESPSWFIPQTPTAPIVEACSTPAGYVIAQNQACAIEVIANDPYCVESTWDSLCEGAYSDCVSGCTYPSACNYSPSASSENGTCVFPGCTDPLASNFDPLAGCDDGSCVFGGAEDCPGDYDGDDLIGTNDLLAFLSLFGSICP